MYPFSIGVIIDSFRTDIPTAVQKAAAVGAQGIQVYATRGEMSPEVLVGGKRREFLDLVKSHGLTISALCGDLGGGGFMWADKNPEKIERSKRIIDLAKELETDVVTTHIGVVPADSSVDRFKVMQEACYELAMYADSVGAHFAVETGPETSAVLKNFLDSLSGRRGLQSARLYRTYARQGRPSAFLRRSRKRLRSGQERHHHGRFLHRAASGRGRRQLGRLSCGAQRHRLQGLPDHRARGRRRSGEGHPQGGFVPGKQDPLR